MSGAVAAARSAARAVGASAVVELDAVVDEALDALPQRSGPEVVEAEERLGHLHAPDQRGLEELVAIGEVAVDRPQRDPGLERDVLDRGEPVPLHEQLVNRVQDGVGVAVAPRRTAVELDW